MRILLIGVLLLSPARAGTEPKAKAAEYSHHAAVGETALAAEFHGRGIPDGFRGMMAGDFVVVEVAVFPPRETAVAARSSYFRLRIDGKPPILPSPPMTAGLALSGSMLERQTGLQMGGAVGPAVITVDGPRAEPRFPGDPAPGGRPRTPRQPRVPDESEKEKAPEETPTQTLQRLALNEEETTGPRAGLLYFYWKPKLTKAKSIVLLYEGPAGRAELKLK